MIRVVLGVLEDTDADAIVRPVSAEWDAVTPSMRRLEIAAGPELAEQCRRLGELPVGSAVITPAGDLDCAFMVHTVVRSADEPVTRAGVRRALQNGLRRLSEWAIGSAALAPLGTGAGNLEAEEAAQVMLETLREHMQDSATPADVTIVVDSDYELDVFTRHLSPDERASLD